MHSLRSDSKMPAEEGEYSCTKFILFIGIITACASITGLCGYAQRSPVSNQTLIMQEDQGELNIENGTSTTRTATSTRNEQPSLRSLLDTKAKNLRKIPEVDITDMGINATFPVDTPIPPVSLHLNNNRVKLRLNIDVTTEALIALLTTAETGSTPWPYEHSSSTSKYTSGDYSSISTRATSTVPNTSPRNMDDGSLFMDEIPDAPKDIVVGQPVEIPAVSTSTTATATTTFTLPPECAPFCPLDYSVSTSTGSTTSTTATITTSTSTISTTTVTAPETTTLATTTPGTTTPATSPEATIPSTTTVDTTTSRSASPETTATISATSSTTATTSTTPDTTTSMAHSLAETFYGWATAPAERGLDFSVTPIPHYTSAHTPTVPKPSSGPKLSGPAICIPIQGQYIGTLFPVSQSMYWDERGHQNTVFKLLTESLIQSNLSSEVKAALHGLALTKGQFVALLNRLSASGLSNPLKLILSQKG